MATGCILALLLAVIGVMILFVITGPPGWILAGVFGLAAVIVALFRSIDWKSRSKKHGSEDIGRGPNDDQMYQ
jgi:hypothetical protein